jgi:hypothetical protein
LKKYIKNSNNVVFISDYDVLLDENKLRYSCLFFDNDEALLQYLNLDTFDEIPEDKVFFIEHNIDKEIKCINLDNDIIKFNTSIEDFIIDFKNMSRYRLNI